MLRELFKSLNLDDQRIPLNVKVPDDFYRSMLQELLERDYLSGASEMKFVNLYANDKDYRRKTRPSIHWMQITRLPVHPNQDENYDLLTRWEGVLSSLHAWHYRLYFLLMRYNGKTKIFLGTSTDKQEVTADQAVEQFREAAFSSMPGMGLRILDDKEAVLDEINLPLQEMKSIGAVTGIPSIREAERKGMLQTLDQLAFGLRDANGGERDYAMMVIADPISDAEITDIISRHRRLSSQIHSAVKLTGNEGQSKSESYDPNYAKKQGANVLGSVIGTAAGVFLGKPGFGAQIGALFGGQIANAITSNANRQITMGGSNSLGYEYLDKFAEFAEESVNHSIERLNTGRNFGFWNAGVYVMGTMPRDVVTVTGILRSVYSGEQTYYEPIRLHYLAPDSNALEIVRNHFDMPLLLDANVVTPKEGFQYEKDQWHVFGKYYQYLSTPMNTRELSLATSLPRRDVPGLRFVKTAVRFANNPAVVGENKITLGNIVDTGIEQHTTYDIDVNSLVRHALVAGSTGSGKSTTCKRIITEVLRRDIPVLIIEPAKDDYVRWAFKMNEQLPPEKRFKIYMPGVDELDGHPIEKLSINPFEPACAPGAKVDLLQHTETFSTLLNACLPSEEVVPILIEEVVLETIRYFAESNDRDLDAGTIEPLKHYPLVDDMILFAEKIMREKKYAGENRSNLTEVLITRFKSLKRGTRGKILNVSKSVDYEALFNSNVIINISRLSGSKDKSLVMSLLMNALYEYRASRYANDAEYRRKAQDNRLLHLTLVEEAHNVLLKPQDNRSSGSPERAAAELFGNMLSDVRGYGQGLMVVDQVPTRLIEDAIKNTNYKIVHRLTAPDDQEIMASCMAFREDQKYIIPALEKGNAIICGDEDDAAAWVKIPAPRK